MLSITDFIGCSNLYECEVEAIAEHEHIPLPAAVVMGEYLLTDERGVCLVHQMIAEDIQQAIDDGDLVKAQKFAETYKFVARTHPLPRH